MDNVTSVVSAHNKKIVNSSNKPENSRKSGANFRPIPHIYILIKLQKIGGFSRVIEMECQPKTC